MNILTTPLYEEQLKGILELILEVDYQAAKSFKTYLETIIINIPSKEQKYKKSIYFDDEKIKDVEFQGCVIIFYVEKSNNTYIILGITTKA
jgi:hypothetical protein